MNLFQRHPFSAVAALSLVVLSGCASVAVTDTALQTRTASSLGLQAGSFTITNRQDAGVRTDYDVSTSDGRRFACYVTGAVSVTGRNVSDAMCQPIANPSSGASGAAATSSSACNALLKAAGRC